MVLTTIPWGSVTSCIEFEGHSAAAASPAQAKGTESDTATPVTVPGESPPLPPPAESPKSAPPAAQPSWAEEREAPSRSSEKGPSLVLYSNKRVGSVYHRYGPEGWLRVVSKDVKGSTLTLALESVAFEPVPEAPSEPPVSHQDNQPGGDASVKPSGEASSGKARYQGKDSTNQDSGQAGGSSSSPQPKEPLMVQVSSPGEGITQTGSSGKPVPDHSSETKVEVPNSHPLVESGPSPEGSSSELKPGVKTDGYVTTVAGLPGQVWVYLPEFDKSGLVTVTPSHIVADFRRGDTLCDLTVVNVTSTGEVHLESVIDVDEGPIVGDGEDAEEPELLEPPPKKPSYEEDTSPWKDYEAQRAKAKELVSTRKHWLVKRRNASRRNFAHSLLDGQVDIRPNKRIHRGTPFCNMWDYNTKCTFGNRYDYVHSVERALYRRYFAEDLPDTKRIWNQQSSAPEPPYQWHHVMSAGKDGRSRADWEYQFETGQREATFFSSG